MQFDHVTAWVFDLDNTLYHPSVRLFDQIEARMNAWITNTLGIGEAAAIDLRKRYWAEHGTTLAGLMADHDIDPEHYLEDVHAISFAALTPDPDLAQAITDLPGRKIVYTNGSAPYARRVIEARGLSGLFDAVYGIENADYRPKPRSDAFTAIFAQDGLSPSNAAMFEDDPRNLAAPHAMGMRTVHVAPTAAPAPHIHHHTDDLAAFLSQIANPSFSAPKARTI